MAWTAPRTWSDGELVTASIMNTHIRDNQLAEGAHLIVRKTSDQSVTSSTAFVSDSALTMSVGTNEVWLFEFVLIWTGAAAGDLKVSFSLPASSEINASAFPPSDATGIYQDLSWQALTTTDSQPFIFTGTATNRFLDIKGVYVGGGTAGSVTLRWAQGTSSGTATTVKTNSTLWAVKLA